MVPEQFPHSILICKSVKVRIHMISPRVHTVLKEIKRSVDVPFSPGVFTHGVPKFSISLAMARSCSLTAFMPLT
jgi:hypothetical protein